MAEDTFREVEDFVQRLIEAGWSREDAEKEWERIQDDDESGY